MRNFVILVSFVVLCVVAVTVKAQTCTGPNCPQYSQAAASAYVAPSYVAPAYGSYAAYVSSSSAGSQGTIVSSGSQGTAYGTVVYQQPVFVQSQPVATTTWVRSPTFYSRTMQPVMTRSWTGPFGVTRTRTFYR